MKKRSAVIIVACSVLTVGNVAWSLAQLDEETAQSAVKPTPKSTAQSAPFVEAELDSRIGSTVTYGDVGSGIEVTLVELEQNATTTESAWTGDDAVFGSSKSKFIAFKVRLKNVGENTRMIPVNGSFRAVNSQGGLISLDPGPDSTRVGRNVERVRLVAGGSAEAVMNYSVPNGAEVAQVLWMDSEVELASWSVDV